MISLTGQPLRFPAHLSEDAVCLSSLLVELRMEDKMCCWIEHSGLCPLGKGTPHSSWALLCPSGLYSLLETAHNTAPVHGLTQEMAAFFCKGPVF